MAETGKICPHCGRKISGNAPKCPFCRAKINETPASEQKQVIKNSRLNALLNGEPEPEEIIGASPAIQEQKEDHSPIAPVISENLTAESEAKQEPVDEKIESEPVSNPEYVPTPDPEPAVQDNEPVVEEPEKESPRGRRMRKAEPDTDDAPVREKKGLFGKKKAKDEKKPADEYNSNYPADEEITYNANSDGYYDDVVPELAEQINRLPTENILRLVFTLIFVIVVVIIALQNF